jgi:hypothetical protein
MLLQLHRLFDTVADYDPATGRFETFSRRAEPNRVAGHISGVYDYIGGKRMLLYRVADGLFLEIDGQRLPLEKHAVDVRHMNGRRILRVLSADKVIIELPYDPPELELPLSLDPTAFAEEEDFDFGLLLHNVSRDPSRQMRMYRNR